MEVSIRGLPIDVHYDGAFFFQPLRMWELSGVPCAHAVAVIYKCDKEPEDYVCEWFRCEMFKEGYKNNFLLPVEGMDMWPENNLSKPLPPPLRKMPGRPKKNRIRAAHEPRVVGHRVTKHGVVMTCQRCFQKGHNQRSCKNENVERVGTKQKNVKQSKSEKVGTKQKELKQSKTEKAIQTTSVPYVGVNQQKASQHPPTPRKFGVTKQGFKWVLESYDVDGMHGNSSKTVPTTNKKVGKKVAFGKAMDWLSCGLGSSGLVTRQGQANDDPLARQSSERTAPNQPPTAPSQPRTAPAKLPVRRRPPSERVLKKKLAKPCVGLGSTQEKAIVMD